MSFINKFIIIIICMIFTNVISKIIHLENIYISYTKSIVLKIIFLLFLSNFKNFIKTKELIFLIFAIFITYIIFIYNFNLDSRLLLLFFLIKTMFTAIFEETLFRKHMYNYFLNTKKKNKIYSITLTTVIFSLVHSINFIQRDAEGTLNQIIFALFMGFFLQGVYIRNGLTIAIVIHFIINVLGGYSRII